MRAVQRFLLDNQRWPVGNEIVVLADWAGVGIETAYGVLRAMYQAERDRDGEATD